MKSSKKLAVLSNLALGALLGGCNTSNAPSTAAMLPPKYLEISEFKSCLQTTSVGTYEQWCLPASKPDNCPSESWTQLGQLQGGDKVPECP